MRLLIDASGVGYGGLTRLANELDTALTASKVPHRTIWRASSSAKNRSGAGLDLLRAFVLAFKLRKSYDTMLCLSPSIVALAWWGKHVIVNYNDLQTFIPGFEVSASKRAYRYLIYKLLWLNADLVTAISHTTADGLTALFGQKKVVEVIPLCGELSEGVPPEQALNDRIPEAVNFVIPAHSKHKRAELALAALASDELSDATALLLAGPRLDELTRTCAALGVEGRVAVLGHLSDSQYRQTLTRAGTLVMLSYGEGFGIPVAEALTLGKNVVTSNDPALRETACGLGFSVDPENRRQLISRLVESLNSDEGSDQIIYPLRDRSWHDVAEDYLRMCM